MQLDGRGLSIYVTTLIMHITMCVCVMGMGATILHNGQDYMDMKNNRFTGVGGRSRYGNTGGWGWGTVTRERGTGDNVQSMSYPNRTRTLTTKILKN